MTYRATSRGWALTKVQELLHGQGRRAELGEALHLFRGSENGAVFHQKLGEFHIGSLSPNAPSLRLSVNAAHSCPLPPRARSALQAAKASSAI